MGRLFCRVTYLQLFLTLHALNLTRCALIQFHCSLRVVHFPTNDLKTFLELNSLTSERFNPELLLQPLVCKVSQAPLTFP